jgi:carbonic anhydrase
MTSILRTCRTAAIAGLLTMTPLMFAERVETRESQSATTVEAALDRLIQGNRHFVMGKTTRHNWKFQRSHTAEGQFPYAAVLSCMDSRTSPEIIFDQGIGDIFDARVAGNVVDDDVLASLEYATRVAGAKLIAVVGHTSCGAVKGAVDDVHLGHVTDLVAKIKPVVDQVAGSEVRTSKNHELVDRVAEANVRLVVRQVLEKSDALRELAAQHKIKVVGAMYDLHSGKVTFLQE